MATLDETNIFQTPVTAQEPKRFSPEYFTQRQAESDIKQAEINQLGEAVKQNFAEGNMEQAYEAFTQLPVADQMVLYMTPVLGNAIDAYEAKYFAEKAKPEFIPQEELSPFRDQLNVRFGDPLSGALSGLAGLSSVAGLGEIPSLIKGAMLPLARRGMQAKVGEGIGGGGGGIGELVPQPKQDYAGYFSNVEKQALESMNMQDLKTGQDLINYLQSKRRSGISPKELEFINLEELRASNPTKEEVVKYIQDNRPNIYRVARSEDNPTYQADTSDNPLMELPMDEEATLIANREEQDYFRDEYAGELERHNEIITDNQTLRYSNYRLNSENINDPSVLEAVDKYLQFDPEAFNGVNPAVIEIKYPDGRVAFFNNDDFVTGNNLDVDGFTMKDLQEAVKDGATIEFPALAETDDIIEEASAMRVSPDYGSEIEVYRGVGESGHEYKIIGSSETGYRVMIDGNPATGDLGTFTTQQEAFYNDLADARARVQAEAFDNSDIVEGASSFDTGSNADQLSDTAPFDVITGEATLPTRFGYQYDDYRLPMGGAKNYREFTLHIANPNTPTRYSSSQGVKHFGGGDELLHYRTTDRIDEDGARVLFVEEIQSDLHSTASSTKVDSNYEVLPKKADEVNAKISKINKDFKIVKGSPSSDGYFYHLDIGSYAPNRELNMGTALNLKDAIEGKFPMSQLGEEYQKIAKDLVDIYGKKQIIDIFSELEPFRNYGTLPDYPYKGNDWIELAVKDIMKLAAEGDYDRVAFTNPATQLRRNSKNLEYIDEIQISQVPDLTEAEVEFDKNWNKNRDATLFSIDFNKPLSSADLNSFLNIHTGFVLNDPQAQKYWQEFYKDRSSSPIFAGYDSAPTPYQIAEGLYKNLILYQKKQRLNAIKDVNKSLVDLSADRPQGALTPNQAYENQLKLQENISGTLKLPNKPFDEITLDDIPVSDEEIKNINSKVRENISAIMRNFHDHALPYYEDSGKYVVKQKGTGYKEDIDKFMIERGNIKEDYKKDTFQTIETMLDRLRVDENTKNQIISDAQKGLIPQSFDDAQIYKIEKEMGSGKKPFDMYAKIIPQQARKFAEKYDASVKPQLKKILYEDQSYPNKDSDINTIHQNYLESLKTTDDPYTEGLRTHEAFSIDITPKMKEQLLKGVNVMYKGGIVSKYKSMDKPIMGGTRDI
jgi:hypothetical protein